MSLSLRQNSPMFAWLVCFLGAAFYLYQFILRTSPSVMADQLMLDFGVNATALGVLAACYYYPYTVLQLPLGIVLDHWGPRVVLRVVTLLCCIGALIFALSPNVYCAAGGRLLIGTGAAGVFLSTIRLSTLWLPPHQLALGVSITIALGKLGALAANLPLAFLIEYSDWRWAMLLVAMVGFVVSGFVWLFIPEKSDGQLRRDAQVSQVVKPDSIAASAFLLSLLKRPGIWGLGIYGALMYVPLSVFVDIWGIPFLIATHGISKATASGMVSCLLVGSFLGAPLIAIFSDVLCQRKLPVILSALFSLGFNCALIFLPNLPLSIVSILLFFVGISFAGQTLIFVMASEQVPLQWGGTVTGFTNTIVMFGGALLQPTVGWLLDGAWGGDMQGGGGQFIQRRITRSGYL